MKELKVYYHGRGNSITLGRLAYHSGVTHLELDKDFVNLGLNFSPFTIKLNTALQSAKPTPFDGLHGVFADSLPDGWGMLLMKRRLRQKGIAIEETTPLGKLAYMGDRAMGALSYQPDTGEAESHADLLAMDQLARDSLEVYDGAAEDVIKKLSIVGGSPGGARPKATIGISKDNKAISGAGNLPKNYGHWLVKFPTGKSAEEKAEGGIEYAYALMAKQAKINVPEIRLFESSDSSGFFGIKRFDRGQNNQRIHMHTFAGLVNADYRVPDADYKLLMKATSQLTKNHDDLCEVLRRMIFNILSGNRDDHTKNFSFLMDSDGQWRLSPAYDVTFNHGIHGEHSMSVNNKGKNITLADIEAIANMIPLKKDQVKIILLEVAESLQQWPVLAKKYNITKMAADEISAYIKAQTKNLSG